jgi:hypothetical protein
VRNIARIGNIVTIVQVNTQKLAPSIVGVICICRTIVICQPDDITLLVQYIVVGRSIIYQCIWFALVVRQNVQRIYRIIIILERVIPLRI